MSKKRAGQNVCRSAPGGYTCTPRHRCCVFRESVVNRNSSSNTTCEVASGVLYIEHIHTHSCNSTTSAAFSKSCIFSDAKKFIFLLLLIVTSQCSVGDLRAHVLSEGNDLRPQFLYDLTWLSNMVLNLICILCCVA